MEQTLYKGVKYRNMETNWYVSHTHVPWHTETHIHMHAHMHIHTYMHTQVYTDACTHRRIQTGAQTHASTQSPGLMITASHQMFSCQIKIGQANLPYIINGKVTEFAKDIEFPEKF